MLRRLKALHVRHRTDYVPATGQSHLSFRLLLCAAQAVCGSVIRLVVRNPDSTYKKGV